MRRLPLLFVLGLSAATLADTVVLKNGDILHGKIGLVTPAQLKFQTAAFGEIGIKMSEVARYEIDQPAIVKLKEAEPIKAKVSGVGPTTIKADDTVYTFDQVRAVNPPPEDWNGAVLANFSLARGNTNKYLIGVDAKAALRRENFWDNDRTTLAAQYNFGQSGGGPGPDDVVTDTDNWLLSGKYDRFWTQKLYGYVSGKLEHDRIADLTYRASPNVGLGYQWIETPATNFNTEAGFGYVFEHFDDDTNNDYVSVRLAYHFERALTDKASVFHDLEYLPSIDNPSDYNLNTDVGLKMTLVQNFVAQFKIEYKRDSTPAEGALKNDVLYLVGLGWQF